MSAFNISILCSSITNKNTNQLGVGCGFITNDLMN